MRNTLFALVMIGLVLPITTARAEDASPPPATGLQIEVKRKRHIVRPLPSPAMTAEDADRAATQIQERWRDEQRLRQQPLPPQRRPDLDYDVVSGIQARNLGKALRR